MFNKRFSFGVVTSLFFIWGFLTCMNDLLIPYLKKVFELSYAQAMLVQFAFFIAYFIGSLIYFVISAYGGDPLNKIGYKNGMIAGLITASLGLALIYPAAQFHAYGFFLADLFVLGLGFTVLQIAANPYVAILGPPATASSRLNLAQGFNSFGTTIAPVIGGYLIFELFINNPGAEAVKVPYVIFSSIAMFVAIILAFIKLPAFTNHEKVEYAAGALRYPQLSLGIIAIFMYCGAEVAIGSMMTSFVGLKEIANLPLARATVYVSLYWGGLMIGRFTGSAALSDLKDFKKAVLIFNIPAFVFFLLLVFIFVKKGFKIEEAGYYIPFLLLLSNGFIASKFHPAKTLMFFSVINIILILVTLFSTGKVALFSIVAVGLFNSIMWSNIFTLAIHNLGKYTSQGSSLLVMGILGAATVPWLQGFTADHIGVQHSYIIPVFCFVYLAFYGFKVRNLLSPAV